MNSPIVSPIRSRGRGTIATSKSGRISDNKWTLGGTTRWLKPAKATYGFGTGRFDYDEFKSWNKRGSLHFGPGYQLYNANAVTLAADVGLGTRRESGSRNDPWKLEGLTGFTLQWQVTEGQAFDAGATYTPVLDDFDDFRARASLYWRLLVSREANLSLLLGLLNEHQSIVDPGIDRNVRGAPSGVLAREGKQTGQSQVELGRHRGVAFWGPIAPQRWE